MADDAHPEDLKEIPAVQSWLGHAEATRRIMKENYAELKDSALLTATVPLAAAVYLFITYDRTISVSYTHLTLPTNREV